MILSALFDFPDDSGEAVYDRSSLAAVMKKLSGMGVRRIYWQWHGDASHQFFWTTPMVNYINCVRTAQIVPDFNAEAVRCAKACGMETVGIVKPYETGLSAPFPPYGYYRDKDGLASIDGKLLCVTDFVAKNPDLRIKRRSYDLDRDILHKDICTIKLYKKDSTPTRIVKENITIYVSDDNCSYQKLETDFALTVSTEVAPRDVLMCAAFGDYKESLITKAGDRVTVITLSGLRISRKFVAVAVRCGACDDSSLLFQNTALAMIRGFDEQGEELQLSVGNQCGIWNRATYWGPNQQKSDPLDVGFAFDDGFCTFPATLDPPDRTGLIALCKGKNEYLSGALCECEPKVQEYFLQTVENCLDAGFDRIDFRIENHSTHTDEAFAYGYNDCIKEEYARRYGACAEQDMALDKIGKIRGDAFTDFLARTARLVHDRGKKFHVTLNTELLRRHVPVQRHIAYPMTVEWQWERWLDELSPDGVTIRTYCHTPEFVLSDPECRSLIDTAKNKRLPLAYLRYIRDSFIQDLETIHQAGDFESIILYEVYNFIKSDGQGGIIIKNPGFADAVTRKAIELGFV